MDLAIRSRAGLTLPDKRSVTQGRLALREWARVKAAAKRERRTVSAWLLALGLDTLDELESKTSLPPVQHARGKGRWRGD